MVNVYVIKAPVEFLEF
jgi:hypothetical protein